MESEFVYMVVYAGLRGFEAVMNNDGIAAEELVGLLSGGAKNGEVIRIRQLLLPLDTATA